jgi:histidinol phosphatase-like enzyme
MNAHLRRELPLDAIEVCIHDDADNCECRKPRPGLLLNAAKREGIALDESFMVGDRYRDSDDSLISAELDQAERALIGAGRSLTRAGRLLA